MGTSALPDPGHSQAPLTGCPADSAGSEGAGGVTSPASNHPAAHGFSSTGYVDREQSQSDRIILINLLSASICHTDRAVAALPEFADVSSLLSARLPG